MFRTDHFETGQFKSHSFHLPDDEYSRALDCLVKACTDILITRDQDGKVLLGKRKVEPQPDWWFVGGRMKPGERVEDSCCRIIRRELSLPSFDGVDRFSTVGTYSFLWEKRSQAPVENGTADISTVLTCSLNNEESSHLKMDESEYEGMQWILPEDVINDTNFHPALRKATYDLLAMRKWRMIEQMLNSQKNVDDSTCDLSILQLLKDFHRLKSQQTKWEDK